MSFWIDATTNKRQRLLNPDQNRAVEIKLNSPLGISKVISSPNTTVKIKESEQAVTSKEFPAGYFEVRFGKRLRTPISNEDTDEEMKNSASKTGSPRQRITPVTNPQDEQLQKPPVVAPRPANIRIRSPGNPGIAAGNPLKKLLMQNKIFNEQMAVHRKASTPPAQTNETVKATPDSPESPKEAPVIGYYNETANTLYVVSPKVIPPSTPTNSGCSDSLSGVSSVAEDAEKSPVHQTILEASEETQVEYTGNEAEDDEMYENVSESSTESMNMITPASPDHPSESSSKVILTPASPDPEKGNNCVEEETPGRSRKSEDAEWNVPKHSSSRGSSSKDTGKKRSHRRSPKHSPGLKSGGSGSSHSESREKDRSQPQSATNPAVVELGPGFFKNHWKNKESQQSRSAVAPSSPKRSMKNEAECDTSRGSFWNSGNSEAVQKNVKISPSQKPTSFFGRMRTGEPNNYSVESSAEPSSWEKDYPSPTSKLNLGNYEHIFSGVFANKQKFIDAHTHWCFAFNKLTGVKTYSDFKRKFHAVFPPSYSGSVQVFCHPNYLTNFGHWHNILLRESQDEMWCTYGCHPNFVRDWNFSTSAALENCIDSSNSVGKLVGLGEIGLDYYRANQYNFEEEVKQQKEAFSAQLDIALRRNLPIVIHCRNGQRTAEGNGAEQDCFRIMREKVPHNHPIHRHCFKEGPEALQPWTDYFTEIKFGFVPGLMMHRDAAARRSVEKLPLDMILLETDAPFFLPPSMNSFPTDKVNGRYGVAIPGGLALATAVDIAKIKQVAVEDVCAQTFENTKKLYRIIV